LASCAAQAAAPELHASDALVLHGARVLTPDGTAWLDGRVVLVSGGRIAEGGTKTEVHEPAGATSIALDGLFLIPGLMDLRTHLLLHPHDEAPGNDQVLEESIELRTIRAVAAARATLEAGFTTVRELGTEGAGFADVGLRDAIAQDIVPGPRILAATRAI